MASSSNTMRARYLIAARRSLEHGDGLIHLPRRDFERWYQTFWDNWDMFCDNELYCLSLCFMAAMARK
jgi:hypothetical protein